MKKKEEHGMKVGVIGAGTMGQGIAKAFAQAGFEVALCDIKQEWAEGGKSKIEKGYARLVQKGKLTQEDVDARLAAITRASRRTSAPTATSSSRPPSRT
jgi:3-hydroxybutyryl-CoA dehydrogenase